MSIIREIVSDINGGSGMSEALGYILLICGFIGLVICVPTDSIMELTATIGLMAIGVILLITQSSPSAGRNISNKHKEMFGYILLVSGFLFLFMAAFEFDFNPPASNLSIGLVLVVLGFIFILHPSREGIKVFIRRNISVSVMIIGMFSISIGSISAVFGVIFRNSMVISIGLWLVVFGLISIIALESSREGIIRFIRNPRRIFEESRQRREREQRERIEIPQTRRAKKRPKGFSNVMKGEYKTIPKDAIDSFTHENIHDVIADGGHVVKCKDCGALYDEGVWEYYGKKCVRIGCGNADV